MSYFKRSLGDGPITDPSQVDDSIIVGEVAPVRVDCATLAADSPWRKPGQVCAPAEGFFDSVINTLFPSSSTATTTTDATAASSAGISSLSPLVIIGGLAVGAYFLFGKKKRA